jgi:hypothetical protein
MNDVLQENQELKRVLAEQQRAIETLEKALENWIHLYSKLQKDFISCRNNKCV